MGPPLSLRVDRIFNHCRSYHRRRCREPKVGSPAHPSPSHSVPFTMLVSAVVLLTSLSSCISYVIEPRFTVFMFATFFSVQLHSPSDTIHARVKAECCNLGHHLPF